MSKSQTQTETPQKKREGFLASSSFSTLAALVFLAAIAFWMLSGEIVIGGSDKDRIGPLAQSSNEQSANEGQKNKQTANTLFTVKARISHAKPRKEVLHVRARSEAIAKVEIRAETQGRVVNVSGRKGQLAKKGDVLCKLDEGTRRAIVAQAKAQLEQTRANYQATRKLARKGASAKLQVTTKRAAYDAAVANLEQAELDLDNTMIKAPFTGLIEDQPAKVGNYLSIGNPCAKLVKLHPLLLVGDVSERNIGKLKIGQKATAELITGEKVKGTIRFISPSAVITTRTFRIEVEVDNKKLALRDGVTADIHLPLGAGRGHLISPAILTLNDQGEVGVRVITKGNIVRFMPTKILEQGTSGVWVAGLPEKVTMITVGQDYVVEGQEVAVEMEQDDKGAKINVRS